MGCPPFPTQHLEIGRRQHGDGHVGSQHLVDDTRRLVIGIDRERVAVAGDDPALHAVGDGGVRQHLHGLELSPIHVVAVHLDLHAEFGGEIEDGLDVSALVLDRSLHLRQAADRRSAHGKRLAQQRRRLRVGDNSFLRECYEGDVDDAGEAIARAHHAFEGDQLGREVHIDLGVQSADAVGGGELGAHGRRVAPRRRR